MTDMHEAHKGPDLLTIDQVAALFGVDRSTISRWYRFNGLPSVALPTGPRRFRRAEVEQYALARSDGMDMDEVREFLYGRADQSEPA